MATPYRSNTRVGLPSSPAHRIRALPPGLVPGSRQDLPPRPGSAASVRSTPPSRSFQSPATSLRSLPPSAFPGIRQDIPPHPGSAASVRSAPSFPTNPTPLRHQRSLSNLSGTNRALPRSLSASARSHRIPPPPLPVPKIPIYIPESAGTGNISSGRDRKEYITTPSSASTSPRSSTSSGSSLFSSNSRSPFSAASSTTSLGEDEEAIRSKGVTEGPPPLPPKTVEGFGSLLWTRVANAAVSAGNLTVSVSKALEANIVTYMGETTPLGEDSRLTRAMKEYHLSKARDPSDLPTWLFKEEDCRQPGKLNLANGTGTESPAGPKSQSPSSPPVILPILQTGYRSDTADADSRSRSLSRTTKQPQERRGASQSRVRFVEQVHPRRMASSGNLRETARSQGGAEPLPPLPYGGRGGQVGQEAVPFPGSDTQSGRPALKAKLASVDLRGRRPSAGGLPSNVRMVRG